MSSPGSICPRCSTALPEGAVFCNLCGAQVNLGAVVRPVAPQAFAPAFAAQPAAPVAPVLSARPGFVAAGRGMSICHRCGIIAPTKRSTCVRCEQAIGSSLEAVPVGVDGSLWAEVRCAITCRQCGHEAPIDEPELDGTITCPQCNAIQAFDVSAWQDALAHAHAVVDLTGPEPGGRFPTPGMPLPANQYDSIGITHTSAEIQLTGMSIENGVQKTRNLKLSASPGHPLCGKCGCPLAPRVEGSELVMRCPGCADTARYAMEPRLPAMTPGLVAVAAEALRSDRREARLDQTSAGMVISLRCPQCGAGLTVLQGAHAVDCTFCKTSCRVPSRTLLALKKGVRDPAPWWVLFRGPSAKRAELERGTQSAVMVGDVDAAEIAAEIKKRKNAKAKLADLMNAGGVDAAPAEEDPRSKVVRWAVHIAVPVAMLVLVALVGFWKILGAWATGHTTHDVPEVMGP